MKEVIEIKGITKVFDMGDIKVRALRGINLKVAKSEFVAIMGHSGSGKSTLMNLLGCLDKPTSGDYILDGVNIKNLDKNEFADIRNQKIGFVFQGFNLLARATALENVELPLLYDRRDSNYNIKQKAIAALERVALKDRMFHEPSQLSGGQQQRVAIARALVNDPSIILADEPTGNLDSKTSLEVFNLFQELNDQGITIILVTHERDFARYAKRIVELKDGLINQEITIKDRRIAKNDLELIKEKSDINKLFLQL